MKDKRLFLIDGSAIAYRAFFAFQRQPLINSRGENTSAVYGFLRSLLKIQDDESPDYLAAVFDTPEPTFRHKLFPEYKATREKMPDEMRDQLPRIREMLDVMNVPVIEMPGFEADDIMGTLAKQAAQKEIDVFLVTGDKDFMQLVDSRIKIYNPKKANEDPEILDQAGVKKKVGLPPERIIDYMGLTGDASDNVPGVAGVGPKTALELLKRFSNIQDILDNPDRIPSASVRSKIEQSRDNALLSRQLVTIDTNVTLNIDFDALAAKEPDAENAARLFKELEFTTLLERFHKSAAKEDVTYEIIDTEAKLTAFIDALRKQKSFTIDLETTDLDPMKARIVGLSFSWAHGEAWYLPLETVLDAGSGDLFEQKKSSGLPRESTLDRLKPILEDPLHKKCGQNIKYDMLVLANEGVRVSGIDFDTMVASYVINPSIRQHNLDALSLEYLDYRKIPTSELLGTGKNQINMVEVPIDKIAQYACEDADITQRLRVFFEPILAEYNLEELFNSVELPLIHVLLQMERNGVSLDLPFLKKMSAELEEELNRIMDQIFELAGEKFNINSTKQLSEILFTKLKLPVIRKTKTGISTDVNVLEELAKQHPLPAHLLEYRQLSKLKSTYVDALPKLVNPVTKRLHTSYNQTVAATGRLSSSDPNLQNIPIRTEIGRRIRKSFVPASKDYVFLDADYSQIELRIMAHISRDETLLQSFNDDEDVHRRTAALVFKTPPDEVSDDQRRRAKEVNFGIMYGMGAYGLSSRMGIPLSEAEEFITDYFAYYPKVRQYIDETIAQARDVGYVTTLLNRRRYLPEINSENRRIREFAERTAINTPIQGSAADLIKVAMIKIADRIEKENLDAKMIMQVHDELVFEVARKDLGSMRILVKEEMESAIELDVPIKVDMGIGENWYESH
ncbi:MAG: DNA polymerase I [candidate division KSB1 bacterium]|jgi:DNA polymerase-1|nr:DNA polymerase I [candidate division KSB1 bacterium]